VKKTKKGDLCSLSTGLRREGGGKVKCPRRGKTGLDCGKELLHKTHFPKEDGRGKGNKRTPINCPGFVSFLLKGIWNLEGTKEKFNMGKVGTQI